jgi:simple sugar transport system ATP-binding protein
MVHQHFKLVPSMTVAENVALGGGRFGATFDPQTAAEEVNRISEDVGLVLDPWTRAADLPVGGQQRLEIVKALARNAELLILDEPTAVLTPLETEELYRWLRRFVDRGHSVVLITHKLREALNVADDLTVLRRGKVALTLGTEKLSEGLVVDAMLGGVSPDLSPVVGQPDRVRRVSGSVIASLNDVSAVDARGIMRLHGVTLNVFAGELLGVAGVDGAGREELMRILAGRLAPTGGTVSLPDRIGLVPEDRLREALIEGMTLTENFALKDAGLRAGRMPWVELRANTRGILGGWGINALSSEVRASTLSGGNQQKFVIGRELQGSPSLLVAESVVRGLDVRAASQVLRDLRTARDEGVAVVFYSSDIEELLAICDRVVVCFSGQVTSVATDFTSIARALVGAA